MEAHRSALSLGVGVLVVVALSGALGFLYVHRQQQRGGEELQRGIVALQGGDASEAVAYLQAAEQRLSSGEAEQLALFSLGEAYTRLGQLEAAREVYERLSQLSGTESYLSQLALLALGREAEQRNDLSRARQQYEKAASVEGPLRAEAMLATARILERAGERESAASYYEQFLTQYADTPLAEGVRQKVGK
jgi:tetratricopeptide (TPR) repeat protein